MSLQEVLSAKRKRVDSESEVDSSSERNVQKTNFVLSVAKKLYLDEITADVYFQCGPGRERVPAHKCFLVGASDSFHAMFYGPNAKDGDIKLIDISPETFKDFLQFFYLDEVTLKLENITDVMGLAHKYLMTTCLEVCGKFWAEHLTIADICWAYHWAIFYNVNGLKQFCERKISACPETVFNTNGFLTCKHEILENILELDSLACFETSVLEACLNWARNACEQRDLVANDMDNLRIVLNDSLYKIRYGSMELNDFTKCINMYPKLFTNAEDYESIIRLLSGEKSFTGRFNPNPRSTMITWDVKQYLKCNLMPLIPNYSSKTLYSKSFTLSSNHPVLLGGFEWPKISKSNHYDYQSYDVKIDVTITEKYKRFSKVKKVEEKNVPVDSKAFSDFCETPVVINPEYEYCINFKIRENINRISLSYNAFEMKSEFQLNDEITIRIQPEEAGLQNSFIENLWLCRL